MKVIIVRHGLTDWNVQGRMQGHSDNPLNSIGIEQAEKLAKRLQSEKLDTILTSPLNRAKRTAEIIAAHHKNTPFLTEPELREKGLGEAEGYTFEEYCQVNVSVASLVTLASSEGSRWELRYGEAFPGGESWKERVEALQKKVKNWKKQFTDKTILLSTHGACKRALLLAFGVFNFEEVRKITFDNTAVTILRPFESNPLELLNCTKHLRP